MSFSSTIGIVGGVGPYAGLDLNRKIFDQTKAKNDQDHLRVILISSSMDIPDRTEYLLGHISSNPANRILNILLKLSEMDVDVAGIPCNTAHAPEIFNVFVRGLRASGSSMQIVHMIREVGNFMKEYHSNLHTIGVLATNGTVNSDVYGKILHPLGFKVIYPDEEVQSRNVHQSIYNKSFGIKSKSNPVTIIAQQKIGNAIQNLAQKDADCIVLGCTELPLAVKENKVLSRPVLDPTLILARALIRAVAPEKLKSLQDKKLRTAA